MPEELETLQAPFDGFQVVKSRRRNTVKSPATPKQKGGKKSTASVDCAHLNEEYVSTIHEIDRMIGKAQ